MPMPIGLCSYPTSGSLTLASTYILGLLIAVAFANPVERDVIDKDSIHFVDISATESFGVEGQAALEDVAAVPIIPRGAPTQCISTVAAPAATQAGVVSGCVQWYVAQSGDYCYSIAQGFGISVDTFMQWNPAVQPPTCTSLWAGYAYCVATCKGSTASSDSTAISLTTSSTLVKPSITSVRLTFPSPPPNGPYGKPVDRYVPYTGDGTVAARWPAWTDWIHFRELWTLNEPNMRISCDLWGVNRNSDYELFHLRNAILGVSAWLRLDPRLTLAVILQESQGCVRVITTRWSHDNPGLMQSFQGTGSCNTNNAGLGSPGASRDRVAVPCPASAIWQMVIDGCYGTAAGPGLVRNWYSQGARDVSSFYRAVRVYNGGSVAPSGNLEDGCCTRSYASDVANRLRGWVEASRVAPFA